MKLLKTKYYIVRQNKKKQNSYTLIGGPFETLKETSPHVSAVGTEDLMVLTGEVLSHPSLHLQDKRPKTE